MAGLAGTDNKHDSASLGFDGGAARLVPDLIAFTVGGLVDPRQDEARGDGGEIQVHHHIELGQPENALDDRPDVPIRPNR